MDFPRKIYAIRHNATNRVYVGSSHQVEKRVNNHLSRLRNHKHSVEDMQADFDKYGENYTITILEENIAYEDRFKEYEWMSKKWSALRGYGYNYKDKFYKKYVRENAEKTEKQLKNIIRNTKNPDDLATLFITIARAIPKTTQ